MIKVFLDVYEMPLKMAPAKLEGRVVVTINDQRRSCDKNVNSFACLDNLQPGYALFHKLLNFVWMLLKVHQGAIDTIGSLKYFFALLKKTRLGNEKPDYHTLVAALMQILHGLFLRSEEHTSELQSHLN